MSDIIEILLNPIMDSWKTLNPSEQTVIFEDTMYASFGSILFHINKIPPSETLELVDRCISSDVSDPELVKYWEVFWSKHKVEFLRHPMYLSLFLILVKNASSFPDSVILQQKTEVEKTSTYEEALRRFNPSVMN